jgi:hypothetical protein
MARSEKVKWRGKGERGEDVPGQSTLRPTAERAEEDTPKSITFATTFDWGEMSANCT